jgi:hypothetical protein
MSKVMTIHRLAGVVATLFVLLASAGVDAATVWDISNVPQLDNALSNLSAGDEMVLQAGTYYLDRVVALNLPDVTIRGATGNRDDVVLIGGGMNTHGVDEGITIGADNVTVRNLTLKDFFYNALHLRAESDISGAVISNVKTWNIGERHVKGSKDGNLNHTCDNTLIENVYMLQTEPRLDTNPSGGDYIGGMDIMATNNLTIRDCVAEGIRGFTGGGNAAIFLWQGHNNFTIERNVITDCNKGIGIGLCYYAGATISGGWHADGGAIRNNTVLRCGGYDGNNIGLELCGLKNVDVHHNTIYSPDVTYFRNVSVWDDGNIPISNLDVQNNIFYGGVFDIAGGDWSPTAVRDMGNIVDTDGSIVLPDWFVDVAAGDLHLTASATGAIDAAQSLATVTDDVDAEGRPIGAAPDFGADEYVPEPATLCLVVAGACAAVLRRPQ